MNENIKHVWTPILIAAAIVVGILIGSTTRKDYIPQLVTNQPTNKIDILMHTIESKYVDTVDTDQLIEDAIPTIMSELDPHSVYIPAEDLQATNEELEGSFSGIGVQFNIQNDTITVVNVISGGPSERIGLMPGDRIVAINDSAFVGKEVTNDKVMKNLRGDKGTTVKLGVKRSTSKDLLSFDVVRGDIPVHSVDAAYVINDDIGYIKVSKFGRTTYDEFVAALAETSKDGAKSYIIDLRGNSGGFMDMAIKMINEFLAKDMMIVYTEGKSIPRNEAVANGMGMFQDAPLVVLIDEWSASASEIFAGAIQDNDRGSVVGRRSYGKGLVQQQMPFYDGSALRLTIARYHTPSGRCIQKEYELGKGDDYSMDLVKRFEHGEFYSKDSIQVNDSLRFETRLGRTVYGGGGIIPDIFIPHDTTGVTSYFNEVLNKGLIYQYAFQYTDQNREKLSQFKTYDELRNYLDKQNLVEKFADFAVTKGVKKRPYYINISKNLLERQLQSYIIRNVSTDANFYRSFLRDDATIGEAIRLIENNETLPQVDSKE